MNARLLPLPLILALLTSTASAAGYWTWSNSLISRTIDTQLLYHQQVCSWKVYRTWHPDSGPRFTEYLGQPTTWGGFVPLWQPAPACPTPTSF